MRISPQSCILFFVKHPVKGEVKRRLAAELGETIAAELYTCFILDMLATLDTCEALCMICFYPGGAGKKFHDWLGARYHYLPQEGKDLGERMKNGFIKAFGMTYEHVILIGSDIPDLPRSLLKEAIRALKNNDAVLGPAHDGGYYLIGFRKSSFIPEVFDKMKWGENSVLSRTLNRLNQRGCRVHLLPAWHDVDTPHDIMALLHRNKAGKCTCPKTISYLKNASRITSAG
jgi:rSAM/selenodomain-associated transferase 1